MDEEIETKNDSSFDDTEKELLVAVVKLNALDCLSWTLEEVETRLLVLAIGQDFQKYDIDKFDYAIVGAMHRLEPDQSKHAGVMHLHLLFEVRGEVMIKDEFKTKKTNWRDKFRSYFSK